MSRLLPGSCIKLNQVDCGQVVFSLECKIIQLGIGTDLHLLHIKEYTRRAKARPNALDQIKIPIHIFCILFILIFYIALPRLSAAPFRHLTPPGLPIMQSSWPLQPGTFLFLAAPTTGTTGSGRGKPLSTEEKAVLIGLCRDYKVVDRFADHTKRFWVRMSALFTDVSGRVYSWQSCRRCLCAWEKANDQPSGPSSTVPNEVQQNGTPVQTLNLDDAAPPPSNVTSSVPLLPSDHRARDDNATNSAPDDISDDDLPQMPVHPLRRGQTHAITEAPTTHHADTCGLFIDNLEAFEAQLHGFTRTLEQPRDRRDIYRAFDHFRDEVDKGIRRKGLRDS